MNTKTITGQDALIALRKVTEFQGADYVDPGSLEGACTYVESGGGEANCAVGQALQNHLGIPFKDNPCMDITNLDRNLKGEDEYAEEFREHYFGDLVPDLSPDALELFRTFQFHQDQKVPYGKALDATEGIARELGVAVPA